MSPLSLFLVAIWGKSARRGTLTEVLQHGSYPFTSNFAMDMARRSALLRQLLVNDKESKRPQKYPRPRTPYQLHSDSSEFDGQATNQIQGIGLIKGREYALYSG